MKTSRLSGQVAIAALLGALGASACQDPLVDPAVVIAPRVVGARVRAEADPTRAALLPGERASIDWLVLSDQPDAFVAKAVWCKSSPTSLGSPGCEQAPASEATLAGRYESELSFSFLVPEGLQPGDSWLSWLGLCDAGEPVFDAAASAFSCPSGAALAAYYRGFVPDGAPNHNPSLTDDAVSIDGAAWPESDAALARAPREPCSGAPLPSVIAGTPSVISVALGGDDREPLAEAPGQYGAHPRESLVFTHVASHPGLDRAFSAIDYDAQTLAFELTFDDGDAAPAPDGETLTFHLLVRDERGGVDWLRREACLLPPGP